MFKIFFSTLILSFCLSLHTNQKITIVLTNNLLKTLSSKRSVLVRLIWECTPDWDHNPKCHKHKMVDLFCNPYGFWMPSPHGAGLTFVKTDDVVLTAPLPKSYLRLVQSYILTEDGVMQGEAFMEIPASFTREKENLDYKVIIAKNANQNNSTRIVLDADCVQK